MSEPTGDERQTRSLLWLIGMSALLRLAGAATMGLGVDEAYALAVSRPVRASYFDHPPMVFWLTAAMANLTGGASPVLLRLPFIALFAVTTWAMFSLGRTLFGGRAGLFGAIVLNLCGVLGFSDASWMLPDGPLLCGMSVAAMAFASLCFDDRADTRATALRWLLVGVGAGFAGLSKYHAIFLPIGALMFIATTGRWRMLRGPWPWIAGIVAIAMVMPVVWWNASHDWASLRFQAGRAGGARPGLHIDPFLQILAGQIGYVLPWVWGPMMWASWHAIRRGRADERSWLLLWFAVGPIVVFTLVTLGGSRGLPHWQGPGYLFLVPVLGAALDARLRAGLTWPRTWMRRSAIAIVSVATLVVTQSGFGWVNRLAPGLFAKGDPSLEAVGWDALLPAIENRGLLADSSIAFVAASHWIEAGKAGAAMRGKLPTLALTDDPRGFRFQHDPADFRGRGGVFVRRVMAPPIAVTPMDSAFVSQFSEVQFVATVPVLRSGARVFDVQVYRVRLTP